MCNCRLLELASGSRCNVVRECTSGHEWNELDWASDGADPEVWAKNYYGKSKVQQPFGNPLPPAPSLATRLRVDSSRPRRC